MIYIYWPYKKIPQWLERVEATRNGALFPEVWCHGGFGLVVNIKGRYVVWLIAGYFICVDKCQNIAITGGGEGVYIAMSFPSFLQGIKFAKGES